MRRRARDPYARDLLGARAISSENRPFPGRNRAAETEVAGEIKFTLAASPWATVRIWGGNPDPTPSADDAPTTVVATIQTLTSRLGKDRLGFLKKCALVIIDESHHAITTSYTQLLDWFLPEEPTDDDEHMPPVIGLTATPFRGTNEEETRWLANRFGRTVLPLRGEAA
jgi:hypothetical protein